MIAAQKSPLLQSLFRAYNRRYLKQNFHQVHLDGDLTLFKCEQDLPLLVFLNHTSWWDLLLGVHLDEQLPWWNSYSAMDEQQLIRYRFFCRLGVIGVDRTSLNGAREFVSHASSLLKRGNTALWLTAQGEMTSNTTRPIRFQPGAEYIGRTIGDFYATTVVFDYDFWNEKRPEAFISLRPLQKFEDLSETKRRNFTNLMEANMERHLDEFQALKQHRDPNLFRPLLSGAKGISPVYDAVRTLTRAASGNSAGPEHGSLTTPRWRNRHREGKP